MLEKLILKSFIKFFLRKRNEMLITIVLDKQYILYVGPGNTSKEFRNSLDALLGSNIHSDNWKKAFVDLRKKKG